MYHHWGVAGCVWWNDNKQAAGTHQRLTFVDNHYNTTRRIAFLATIRDGGHGAGTTPVKTCVTRVDQLYTCISSLKAADISKKRMYTPNATRSPCGHKKRRHAQLAYS